MASLQEYVVTDTGRKNIPGSMPTFTIAGKVYDNAGTLVADFTGANAISFPAVVATLTDAEIATLKQMVAMWLILTKAGLPNG